MTVRDLKERLEDFDDDLEVAIGRYDTDTDGNPEDFLNYYVEESDIYEARVYMESIGRAVDTLVIYN